MFSSDGKVVCPFLKVTDFGLAISDSDKDTQLEIRGNQKFHNKNYTGKVNTYQTDIYALFLIFFHSHTEDLVIVTSKEEYIEAIKTISDNNFKELLLLMCNAIQNRFTINNVVEHPYFEGIRDQFNETFEQHKLFLTRNIDRIWNTVGVSKNINVLLPKFNDNINVLHKQVKNKYSNPINFSNKTLKRLIYSGIFGLGKSKGFFKKTRNNLNIRVITKNIKQLKHFIVSCPTFKLRKLFTETIKEGKYKDKIYYEMMLDGLLNGDNNVKKRAFEILSIERLATMALDFYKKVRNNNPDNIIIKKYSLVRERFSGSVTIQSQNVNLSNNRSDFINGNCVIAFITRRENGESIGGKKTITKKTFSKKSVKKIVSGKKRTIYTGIRGGKYYLKTKNGKKYKVYVTS